MQGHWDRPSKEPEKEKMSRFENVSNSTMIYLIGEWIKSERDRKILKRRIIDGICFEPLAEEFGLSVRQIKNIVYKSEQILYRHI